MLRRMYWSSFRPTQECVVRTRVVVLRPLPYGAPERLVWVWGATEGGHVALY